MPKNFVNCASNKLQSRWEIAGHKIVEYLKKVESKVLKVITQNDIHNHEHNPTQNAMFRKDYTTVVGRLLPMSLFLENSFIKVETDISYSEKLRAFADSILNVRQQHQERYTSSGFFRDSEFSGSCYHCQNF